MTAQQGIDYQGQPLIDAWWTPAWTAQNQSYNLTPPNPFTEPGFPSGLKYVTIYTNRFDFDGNPLSGFFTFFPSSPIKVTDTSGVTAIFPQRFSGQNINPTGLQEFGNGKIHLYYGRLLVNLLATDNTTVTPTSFTYHVKEHYPEGLEYDISVPKASFDGTNPVLLESLVIPGTSSSEDIDNTIQIASVSTEYVSSDVTAMAGGIGINPTGFPVEFAFTQNGTEPQSGDWHNGTWGSTNPPYVAQILIGPANGGLVLAKGVYQIWVRVITSSQVPVISVGTLVIF